LIKEEGRMKRTGKAFYILIAICLMGSPLALRYAQAAPQEKVKLRLTCGLPITHNFTKAMEIFKEGVETGTKGVVKIETYPGGELFKHMDAVRALPTGGVEMAIVSSSHLVGLNLVGNIGGYYFLVKNKEQWDKAKDKVMPIVDKLYNQKNIKIIVTLSYGDAAFGCNKMLRVPADAKGLKIRGPTKAHLDCIKAWGAVGVSLAAGEVYDALGKGTIDGVCTGWSSHGSRAHYEVVKNFSGPTMFSTWFLMMNLDTWKHLTGDTQKVISQAAEKAAKYTEDTVIKEDEKWQAKMKEGGASLHFFTAEELAEWTKATKPVYDKWLKECTEKGYGDDIIRVLRALKIEGY
jgi:TRAP-type C4-dicarboxylate transport system substrate-binding protein